MQNVATRLADLAIRQEQFQTDLAETHAIADSNARSIQAWEALIEQNKVEAEEERSELRVGLNELRVGMEELRQASRENISQHFAFMERFDRIQERLDRE